MRAEVGAGRNETMLSNVLMGAKNISFALSHTLIPDDFEWLFAINNKDGWMTVKKKLNLQCFSKTQSKTQSRKKKHIFNDLEFEIFQKHIVVFLHHFYLTLTTSRFYRNLRENQRYGNWRMEIDDCGLEGGKSSVQSITRHHPNRL